VRGKQFIGWGENRSDVNGEVVVCEVGDIVIHDGVYDAKCECVPWDSIMAK